MALFCGLQIALYILIYLITPEGVVWQLSHSLDRRNSPFYTQLVVILLGFMMTQNPQAYDLEGYHIGGVYHCPSCGAEFSEGYFLQTHFNRYPRCFHQK